MRRAVLAALAALSCLAASAGDPAERLPDPAAEARARAIFREVRCVVCQNESIDASEADIAADMRRVIRRQVAAGESDAAVRQFMVQRYGDWILLKPPMSGGGVLLWLTPVLVVALGGAYLLWQARKPMPTTDVLSEAEEAELAQALATLPPRTGGNKPDERGDLT